jgi:hypothetical protein
MRQTLNDPGLWRAGDGTQNSLGTIDGYSYAIPICAIFREQAPAMIIGLVDIPEGKGFFGRFC